LLALLLALQGAFFQAGRWDGGQRDARRETRFTDQLATAFLRGQTHLPVEPAPELAHVPNPYDPRYRALWYWDAVYFEGRYYSYWGPAPALLVAAFKAASGMHRVPDRYPLLAFALLLTLAAGAFLALATRGRGAGALLAAALGSLALALGNPLPFLLGHPHVYELAIVAGQAFLFCGLVGAALARTARGRRRAVWDLACASGFALAVASRQSLAPAAAALWLFIAGGWLRREGRRALPRIAVFAAPALLGMLLLGAYNHARFGSPFETGHRFQLTHPISIGPQYLLANLWSYALRPPAWLTEFPFLVARWQTAPPFPDFLPVPAGYLYRPPVAGLLYTSPFLVFAAGALLARLRGPWLRLLAVATSLACALPLVYFASTMRYLGDATPGLCALSVLGLCHLLERWRAWRGVLLAVAALAAAWTAAAGLLLGANSYLGFLPQANPELWRRLERLFSVDGRGVEESGGLCLRHAEDVGRDQPLVARDPGAPRLEPGERLAPHDAQLAARLLQLEGAQRDEGGVGREHELDPQLLPAIAARGLGEEPAVERLLHPSQRLEVARGIGVARPVRALLAADLRDHAREQLGVEQRLHHARLAAREDAHLAEPLLRRGHEGAPEPPVAGGVEPAREPLRHGLLPAREAGAHEQQREREARRAPHAGLPPRRASSTRQAGVTSRSQSSALIMVRPESSEKCTVGPKLPNAPTQKPSTSTRLFITSAGPTAALVRRTASAGSPRSWRR
jgi:hypothetical protein